MSKELKSLHVQRRDAKFELVCPSCGKNREFKAKKALTNALQKQTTCFSCRTIANNKARTGTKAGHNNPAWSGYKDVPGKVLSRLRNGAVQRGLSFEITLEDIQETYEAQNKVCAFSGLPISFGKEASVDRIDSALGYTKDNIQIVHKRLNLMKRDIPNDEFIKWCIAVAKNLGDSW
jgi:hypothetical protein